MVDIIYINQFEKQIKKLDNSIKQRLKKQIKRILDNSKIGKPLRYNLQSEHSIRIPPSRLIYAFDGNTIYFLRLRTEKGFIEAGYGFYTTITKIQKHSNPN